MSVSGSACACSVTRSCPTLCDLVDCSPPGSSVHGIFQAEILEWVAIPPPGDFPIIVNIKYQLYSLCCIIHPCSIFHT